MDAPSLNSLLARWEAAYAQGQDLPAEQLCPDRPEWTAELASAIEARRRQLAVATPSLSSEVGTLSAPPTAPPRPGEGNSPQPVPPLVSWAGLADDPREPPPTVAPEAGPAGPTGASPLLAYEVLSELGRGGMGVVYKARHRSLKRIVALKMIKAGQHANADEYRRFQREAEAVARLQHPNIVQIYEVGQYDGLPFFSLEFCAGGSLHDRLGGKPIGPEEAARLVCLLGQAMQAAHQANVVHRDLKPANVLLAHSSLLSGNSEDRWDEACFSEPLPNEERPLGDLTPKITDFGLAKRLDEQDHTQTGAVMGTPSYMPPEQAQGKKDVGPAADIYALGAILYECLTGRPPFRAATSYDTLRQVITEEPVPPRQLNSRVPVDLETICLKCLQKDSGRRYGSAVHLAQELNRWLTGEPITARPTGRLERAVRWARRRPTVAALVAALVVAALGVLVGGLSFGLYRDQQWRELARQSQRRAEVQSLLGKGHDDEAAGRRAREQDRLAEAARHFTSARSRWERCRTILDEAAPQDDEMRARLDALLADLGKQDQGLADFRDRRLKGLQFQGRLERLGRDRDALLFHSLRVVDHAQAPNRAAVLELAPAALKRFGLDPDRPSRAAAALASLKRSFTTAQQRLQAALSCCEVFLLWADACAAGDRGGREAGLRRALELLDQAAGLARAADLPPSRALHRLRARCLLGLGREEAARRARRRADRVRPATGLDHFLLAQEDYRRGKMREALRGCEAALESQSDSFGPQYLQALCYLQERSWADANAGFSHCLSRRPDFFWPRLLRATVRIERKDLSGAEQDLVRARQQARGDVATYVMRMACGQLALAREDWRAARDQFGAAIQHEPPGAFEAHVNLAQAYQRLERVDAALAELYRATDRQPNIARLYHARAELHLKRGDRANARRDFERTIATAAPGCKERWLASTHVQLGDLKRRAGQHEAALREFDRALRVVEGYIPAYREQAKTLLALHHHAAAGHALDACLARGGTDPVIHRVRALVHEALGEHSRAVEAYARALARRRDPTTLGYRGWAYLRTGAVELALADFEEVLRSHATDADALCGRGQVRAFRGENALALEDAEAALKHGKRTKTLLCNVASIHARVALVRATADRTASRARSAFHEEQAASNRARAAELLDQAVRLFVPPDQRRQFWREQVLKDPALRSVLSHSRLVKLARAYGL